MRCTNFSCVTVCCDNNILIYASSCCKAVPFAALFCSLQFEADRRAFNITINSFGTELCKDDRAKLFPRCGRLYPDGLARLAKADDYEQVRQTADCYAVSAVYCASI